MDIQTLSESELEVMNAIWDKGSPTSVSELLEHFSDTKGWKTTTIATFAVRLINKGFLSVEKIEKITEQCLLSACALNLKRLVKAM